MFELRIMATSPLWQPFFMFRQYGRSTIMFELRIMA